MTGGAVHNTQEWKGSEEYRQALPGTPGLLAADTCDSTLTGSLGMHGRGCLGADPLGSSSRSMEKCRNSLSCILGTSDSVPDCCMSLTPIPGTGGVPGGTVGDGRPRSWSLGGQSSSGSSFTPRIRAAISPSVRTTHSSLFSLLSHFMGSEKQSVLFGKASLKEQSSRNSGYSRAPLGAVSKGRHNRTPRRLCEVYFMDCDTRPGQVPQREPSRKGWGAGVEASGEVSIPTGCSRHESGSLRWVSLPYCWGRYLVDE